jgi:asparagine synthase (glutamine-hydrolysing)
VKVVLVGDGGDELFAGYRRYEVLARERAWRAAALLGAPALRAAPAGVRRDRALRFLESLRPADPAMRMALLLTVETPRSAPERVLSEGAREMLRGSDPFRAYRDAQARFRHLDPVQRMLYTDFTLLLPNTFLEKVDKSTMAHGVEVRVPFLDNELARYALGLPASFKVRGGEKKWILRRALRGIVPDEVLDGPKNGFGVPYEYWLRGPLAEYMRAVLTDPAVARWGLFDPGVLAALMDEHVAGRRNHGFLLWKCLHLALWYRAYLEP